MAYIRCMARETSRLHPIYPEPQNARDVSPGMNVPNIPEGKRPKATDVSPWFGVYGRSFLIDIFGLILGKVRFVPLLGSLA